jgi:hypothetical protein
MLQQRHLFIGHLHVSLLVISALINLLERESWRCEFSLAKLAHTSKPITLARHGGSLSHLGSQGRRISLGQELEANLGNIARPCLKKFKKASSQPPLLHTHSWVWILRKVSPRFLRGHIWECFCQGAIRRLVRWSWWWVHFTICGVAGRGYVGQAWG